MPDRVREDRLREALAKAVNDALAGVPLKEGTGERARTRRGQRGPGRPREADSTQAVLAGRRALVIDRNEVRGGLLADRLARWGMRACVSVPCREAVLAIREAAHCSDPFWAAILDQRSADMDAEGIARAVKARPETYRIHLVLLTPWGSAPEGVRLRELGFAALIEKPFAPAQLLETLAGLAEG